MVEDTAPESPSFKETLAYQKVVEAARVLRAHLAPVKRRGPREAWETIETYLDVSLRVMDKVPFDVIKDSVVTGEIKARLHGRAVG